MQKIYTSILVCLFCFGMIAVQGQEVIATAGNYSKVSGASLSWTVGESFVATKKGDGEILTEGIHQCKITITAVDPINDLSFEISAYPNPVMDHINIKTDYEKIGNLTYALYNLKGERLEQKKMETNEISIPMKKYSTAIYLLKITESGKILKTFKIVKK